MESCACSYNERNSKKEKMIKLSINILGTVIYIVAITCKYTNISLLLYIISYILIAYDILYKAIKNIFKGNMFDENLLMSIATLGAFAIKDYNEGVAVVILYKIGEFLQDLAVDKSKDAVKKVLDIRCNKVNLKIEDKIEEVSPENVKIGDLVIIKTGEKILLDGIILEGKTELDMSILNGESIPKNVKENDEVLSGSINIGGVITVKVTKIFKNSTVSQIINLIENAVNKKSKTESYITKFSKIYTPIVIILAIIIAVLSILAFNISISESIRRALIFLVISCPCALVISIPLGFFTGIGKASKEGILIKGSNYLDILSSVNTIVFDKTGTLTKGNFEVVKIKSYTKLTDEKILENIAICESMSNHYIAKSVLRAYGNKIDNKMIKQHIETAGYGIKANIDGKIYIVGNEKILNLNNITFEKNNETGTIIYLAIDNVLNGYIVLADEIKKDSKEALLSLKKSGIIKSIMLTGDSLEIANDIASKLDLDEVYANLLPADKAKILEDIKEKNKIAKVAYVGDGINDAPVIALADVGIAMGKGTDIAIKTADIVLMTDEMSKLVEAINISKKTKKIVMQNVIFAITVKVIFLILSTLGIFSMWEAVFADVGVTIIAVLNSIRILK